MSRHKNDLDEKCKFGYTALKELLIDLTKRYEALAKRLDTAAEHHCNEELAQRADASPLAIKKS